MKRNDPDSFNESSIRWMLNTTKGFHGQILLSILVSVADTLLVLASTVFLKNLVDAASAGSRELLFKESVFMTLIMVSQIAIMTYSRYLKATTGFRISQHLEHHLFTVLLNKDFTYVNRKHHEEWMNRLLLDVEGISNMLSKTLPGIVAITVNCIGTAYLIFRIAPFFLVLALVAAAALCAFNYSLRTPIKVRQRALRDEIGKKNVYLSEHLSRLMIVKSFSREAVISENAGDHLTAVTQKRMARFRLTLLKDGLQNLGVRGSYLVVVLYCAYGIFHGTIGYGSSVMLLRLITQIGIPLKNIAGYFSSFYDIAVSAERLREPESFPDDPNGPVKNNAEIDRFYHQEFKEIELKDAAFSYLNQEDEPDGSVPTIFSGVDLLIPKHSVVAFTGITGSGKSTFFKVLMNFYKLRTGTMVLRTGDGKEYDLDASYRKLFSYVPQGHRLMAGSIRDMITFGHKTYRGMDEEIWAALETACAKDFVEKLPHGLDTVIMEKGGGLSEGQLQRIAIARALFTKRPILLLDEATSALDEATEATLLEHLKDMTDRTILFVTHRLNGLAICDREVHIDGSRVIMRKLHEQEEKTGEELNG